MLFITLILLLPALSYLLGAITRHPAGWRTAHACALMALLTSVAAIGLAVFHPLEPSPWLVATPLNLIASLLISIIGYVVVRYSVAYLAGDPAEPHYRSWLQLALACASLVVISNHLLVLVVAWSGISISLHQLLVSYPDRFRAVLAAHKKFIFARLAELSLLTAAILLWHHHGSFQISHILAQYPGTSPLVPAQQAAALLLAIAALIKCAQLPIHGWLMQVVEAPTPVSALLHAGIINLGGYLMILMAPLMMAAEPARWLLLITGGLTTVIAALIMMTRISIKVRLAWSTCAQMGLMLVECALGLHELALLHLLAHSAYKAHAFLSSGSAVHTHLSYPLSEHSLPAFPLWLRNLVVSLVLVTTTVGLLPGTVSPAEWSAWFIVVLALSLWLPARIDSHFARSLLLAAVLVGAYLAQKIGFATLLPASPDAGWPAAAWVMLLCLVLITGYGLLMMQRNPLSYRLRQWLFAGLYLDEWVTRTTLKLWPVTLPPSASRHAAARQPGASSSRSQPVTE